jgi:glycerophosphoryl diester phosphodiesterase
MPNGPDRLSVIPYSPRIVAHRGANNVAPENTRAAILACIPLDVAVLELDVRSSRDGVLYNFHDPHLHRTTNGTGSIELRSSGYIDTLDAGSWFSAQFAGEQVPRIESVFREFSKDFTFFLDIKSGSLPEIIALMRSYEVNASAFVWFSSATRDSEFRQQAPEIARKVNIRNHKELESKAAATGARYVEVDLSRVTRDLVEDARERNISVIVADHAGTVESFHTACRSGAALINIDCPERFAAFRASYRSC